MSDQPQAQDQQFPRMSPMYGYVRSRQLEGTYPGSKETGCWLLTAMRVKRAYGWLPEEKWPYNTEVWPPVEPPKVDRFAKKYRIRYYQRVRDLDECKVALYYEHPFNASFEVDLHQWATAPAGKIQMPVNEEAMTSAHNITITGYDDNEQEFSFVNTWGPEWGDNGHGHISYEYFNRFLQEAWIIPRGALPQAERPGERKRYAHRVGTQVLEWGVQDAFGGQLHGVEIDDLSLDDNQAWAFAVSRDGFLDVEELFVRPEWRGRGYGPRLLSVLQARAAKLELPLRLWVPHVDGVDSNALATFCRMVRKAGLRIFESEVLWASFVVTE
jgi:GNAT superfamily N-acetyltransferase